MFSQLPHLSYSPLLPSQSNQTFILSLQIPGTVSSLSCSFIPTLFIPPSTEQNEVPQMPTHVILKGFPRWLSGKESTCQCRRCKKLRFDPWDAKILWSRKWQPTPVFLSEKSYAQRSLVGYSPGGGKELDTTVQLSIHQRGYIKAIVSGGWQGQFYTFPITLIVHRRQEC